MKKCNKCNLQLTTESFRTRKNGNNLNYIYPTCKKCETKINNANPNQKIACLKYRSKDLSKYKKKIKRIERVYNISQNEYETLLNNNNGLCLGCNEKKSTDLDHCHKTGKIRGLLCNGCNMALGLLNDNINTLKRLSKYLTEHNTQ